MEKIKMSLANIQGKLSRVEMRNIMAGSGTSTCPLSCGSKCVSNSSSYTCQCYHAGTSNEYCGKH